MSVGRREAPDFSEVIPLVRGALALAAVFFPRATQDGKAYVRAADALWSDLQKLTALRSPNLLGVYDAGFGVTVTRNAPMTVLLF